MEEKIKPYLEVTLSPHPSLVNSYRLFLLQVHGHTHLTSSRHRNCDSGSVNKDRSVAVSTGRRHHVRRKRPGFDPPSSPTFETESVSSAIFANGIQSNSTAYAASA